MQPLWFSMFTNNDELIVHNANNGNVCDTCITHTLSDNMIYLKMFNSHTNLESMAISRFPDIEEVLQVHFEASQLMKATVS